MHIDTVTTHPPQQASRSVQITLPTDDRATLADRLSLRVGFWLLLRSSRRAEQRAERLDLARLRAHARIREQYERDAAQARMLLLSRAWR